MHCEWCSHEDTDAEQLRATGCAQMQLRLSWLRRTAAYECRSIDQARGALRYFELNTTSSQQSGWREKRRLFRLAQALDEKRLHRKLDMINAEAVENGQDD